ncbi:MAG TPA: mechanosensitive ion channel domain-containing protein [Vicinamibacterales bacterium]|nr:mechanosensitive ion channel domain-containing protein [Vicinamibacterales bacterium]
MPEYVLTVLTIAGAFGAAAAVVAIAHAIVRRAIATMGASSPESRQALHDRATRLMGSLRLLAFGVAALASVSLALARFGITEPTWEPRAFGRWVLTHGVNLVIIVAGAAIVIRVANLAIENLQQRLSHRHTTSDLEWQRRASTLGGILTSLVTVTVWFVAILMVLRELSIDVLPILTGAGIAGLAIGFGAQNLVRDVISGFFLILEDQVRVGDMARINGASGVVEQINLRTIVLRDAEGAVQVFPNGTVNSLANLSKQFSYAVVEVRVLYSENLDRVFGSIRDVGVSMQEDPRFQAVLVGAIEIPGVVSIADGVVTISARFKTLPLNQGRVANELRRRLVGTLAGRGIRPYAQ